MWSNDPVYYAGGNVAPDWASHAVQVKRFDPEYKGYIGPPGWDFCVGLKPYRVKNINIKKYHRRRSSPTRVVLECKVIEEYFSM